MSEVLQRLSGPFLDLRFPMHITLGLVLLQKFTLYKAEFVMNLCQDYVETNEHFVDAIDFVWGYQIKFGCSMAIAPSL